MLHRSLFLSLVSVLSAVPAAAQWQHRFADATAQAAESGRDVLLVFTGSDWCVPCKQLHDKVLATDGFLAGAATDFVLVELDYPRKKGGQEEWLVEQNNTLRDRYQPNGYPTVMLVDPAGQPFASFTGYRGEAADAYLKKLEDARQLRVTRDELFARAAAASGLERATLLREALEKLGGVSTFYTAELAEALRLEAEAELGPRQLAERYLQDRRVAAYGVEKDREQFRRHAPALTDDERARLERQITDREFAAVVGGRDLLSLDVESAEFDEVVTRVLALHFRSGRWPIGSTGNRSLLTVMRWADHRRDIELFARCIEDMREVRKILAGNEEFFAWFEQRLEALRTDAEREPFADALKSRAAAKPRR